MQLSKLIIRNLWKFRNLQFLNFYLPWFWRILLDASSIPNVYITNARVSTQKTMRNDHLLVSPSLAFRVQRMFYGSPNCAELYIRFHSVSTRFYFVDSRTNISDREEFANGTRKSIVSFWTIQSVIIFLLIFWTTRFRNTIEELFWCS